MNGDDVEFFDNVIVSTSSTKNMDDVEFLTMSLCRLVRLNDDDVTSDSRTAWVKD